MNASLLRFLAFVDSVVSFRVIAAAFFVLALLWGVRGEFAHGTYLATLAIFMRVCAIDETFARGA